MKYNINDVLSGAEGKKQNEIKEIRIPCPLGDDCTHASSQECDAYRQELLIEEHKKTCKLGANCYHFSASRGTPEYARYTQESPAEYLKRTRGVK